MTWLLPLEQRAAGRPRDRPARVLVCMAGMALGTVKFRGRRTRDGGRALRGHRHGPFRATRRSCHARLREGVRARPVRVHDRAAARAGFFAALREQGLRLNLFAAAIVALGAVCAAVAGWMRRVRSGGGARLFSGATTNTPSLGAAQQTLATLPGISADRLALPALAYAVAYPAGDRRHHRLAAGAAVALPHRPGARGRGVRRRAARRQRAAGAAHARRREPGPGQPAVDEIPGQRETGVAVSRLRTGRRRRSRPAARPCTGRRPARRRHPRRAGAVRADRRPAVRPRT